MNEGIWGFLRYRGHVGRHRCPLASWGREGPGGSSGSSLPLPPTNTTWYPQSLYWTPKRSPTISSLQRPKIRSLPHAPNALFFAPKSHNVTPGSSSPAVRPTSPRSEALTPRFPPFSPQNSPFLPKMGTPKFQHPILPRCKTPLFAADCSMGLLDGTGKRGGGAGGGQVVGASPSILGVLHISELPHIAASFPPQIPLRDRLNSGTAPPFPRSLLPPRGQSSELHPGRAV